ncbi:MAG: efflux RND transporter permease subunit [Capsulimonadales bacterium]|nr:efflux RND transporter permease subunit [Capsulimonadales bacterium]
MQNLARISVMRPVFATVLVLALVVVGLFAIPNLPLDRFPSVDFPAVTITTTLPGATPEEMDTDVTEEIEKQVGSVSGIDSIISSSSDGISVVQIQFVLERNGDIAAQDVRSKIDLAIPNLPSAAERPIVQKFGGDAAPIMNFVFSGDAPIRDLTEYADKTLRPQLESINGVGQVNILGGRLRQINVLLDPYKLRKFGLTVLDVRTALAAQNQQVPGGSLDQGDRRIAVRTQGRVETVAQMRDIVVRTDTAGRAIRVGDVALVEDGEAEPTSAANVNGRPSVLLQVKKQSGANSTGVIDAVKQRLEEIKPTLPPTYEYRITTDQSRFAKAAVHAVQEHLILGSILAALVVLVFLWNWRSTLIAAIAIPSSIISSFALMWAQGFTLNVITLLALTLAVGIVIDDAIIVLENIFKFIEEKGMRPRQAAIEGAKEISLAVFATTLSLVAVFLPVAFMTGIVGRFLNSFGLTMAFAIGVSFLVAFTLTPMLSARWLKAPKETMRAIGRGDGFKGDVLPEREAGAAHKKEGNSFLTPLENAYAAVLRWSLRHRWVVLLVTLGVFFSTVPLIGIVGKNFLPDEDESQFLVSVRATEDRSLQYTERLLNRMAEEIRQLPEVRETIVTVGQDIQQTQNKGEILVQMNEMEDRKTKLSQFDLMNRVRTEIVPKYPRDLRTLVSPPNAFGQGAQAGMQFVINGPDLGVLSKVSQKIVADLKTVPGVADADTSLVIGKPEVGVYVDRERAGDLGVTVGDVAATMRIITAGDNKASSFTEGGKRYDVNLRALPQYREQQAGLALFTVPTSKGQGAPAPTDGQPPLRSIPLRQVVKFRSGNAPSVVERYGRTRSVTVSANLLPGVSEGTIQQRVMDALKAQNLGPQYRGEFAGRSRELGKTFTAFGTAFLLSIIFMYLILAAQFESWVHPITILLALPLTVPFALVSLIITGNSLNIYSMLGLLVLFGIVKKNSILQVDHANQLLARGLPTEEAIVQASKDRLRPILMTTVAFVAGMLPLALSSGVGAGTNRATSGIIIGGQTLSLALTLIATPVFYSLFHDMTQGIGKLRRRFLGPGDDQDEKDPDGDGEPGDREGSYEENTVYGERKRELSATRREGQVPEPSP